MHSTVRHNLEVVEATRKASQSLLIVDLTLGFKILPPNILFVASLPGLKPSPDQFNQALDLINLNIAEA